VISAVGGLGQEGAHEGAVGLYEVRVGAEPGAVPLIGGKAREVEQGKSADAVAIRRWARLLTEVEDYYGYVRDLGSFFRQRPQERFDTSLADFELLLCIAGYLGDSPVSHPEISHLDAAYLPDPTYWKLPGMRYVLASEFLRNLGWEGFKPDRHIQRLFDRWYPQGVAQVKPEVERLQSLIAHSASRPERPVKLAEKLSEKGWSDAPSVDSAGIRRSKWAERYRFGDP
jgi:hypothetical protein